MFSWIFCSAFNYSICFHTGDGSDDGSVGKEMDAEEKPPVYCKSNMVEILVSQMLDFSDWEEQLRGQESWLEEEWHLVSKGKSWLPDFCCAVLMGIRATFLLTLELNPCAQMTIAIYDHNFGFSFSLLTWAPKQPLCSQNGSWFVNLREKWV